MDIHSHLISRGLLDRSFFSGIELLKELSGYWNCLKENPQEVSNIRKFASAVVNLASDLSDISNMFLACGMERTGLGRKECKEARSKLDVTEQDYMDGVDSYMMTSASWDRLTACLSWFEAWVLTGDSNNAIISIAEVLQTGTDRELATVLQGFRDLWNGENGYNNKTTPDDKGIIRNRAIGLLDAISRLLGTLEDTGGSSPEPSSSSAKISGVAPESIAAIVRLMRHISRHFLYYCQLI